MTDSQRKGLIDIGVALDEALDRCMNNEGLYLRCLSKFIEDSNYSQMMEAIETNDVKKAFEASHGLKGVCANLGLEKLNTSVSEIVEIFRNGSMNYRPENLTDVKNSYELTIETIKNIL